jgi:predicted nucleotidyltransferase
MDKKSVIEIVNRFSQGIMNQGIKPTKIILYGSHANNTDRETSDIDIVVISDDFNGKSFWERIDIISEVIYEIFAPIEAVAMTPEEWNRGDSFVVDFAQNGEVLFAA